MTLEILYAIHVDQYMDPKKPILQKYTTMAKVHSLATQAKSDVILNCD